MTGTTPLQTGLKPLFPDKPVDIPLPSSEINWAPIAETAAGLGLTGIGAYNTYRNYIAPKPKRKVKSWQPFLDAGLLGGGALLTAHGLQGVQKDLGFKPEVLRRLRDSEKRIYQAKNIGEAADIYGRTAKDLLMEPVYRDTTPGSLIRALRDPAHPARAIGKHLPSFDADWDHLGDHYRQYASHPFYSVPYQVYERGGSTNGYDYIKNRIHNAQVTQSAEAAKNPARSAEDAIVKATESAYPRNDNSYIAGLINHIAPDGAEIPGATGLLPWLRGGPGFSDAFPESTQAMRRETAKDLFRQLPQGTSATPFSERAKAWNQGLGVDDQKQVYARMRTRQQELAQEIGPNPSPEKLDWAWRQLQKDPAFKAMSLPLFNLPQALSSYRLIGETLALPGQAANAAAAAAPWLTMLPLAAALGNVRKELPDVSKILSPEEEEEKKRLSHKVAELYQAIRRDVDEVAQYAAVVDDGSQLFWHPEANRGWVALSKQADVVAWSLDSRLVCSQDPPPYDCGWLHLKIAAVTPPRPRNPIPSPPVVTPPPEPTAASFTETPASTPVSQYTKPLVHAANWAQKPLGGPSPLSTTLLGAALGAGGGYLGGKLLQKLMPEEYFDEEDSNLATLGLVGGGLLGAAPGLAAWHGAAQHGGDLLHYPAGAFGSPLTQQEAELPGYLKNEAKLQRAAPIADPTKIASRLPYDFPEEDELVKRAWQTWPKQASELASALTSFFQSRQLFNEQPEKLYQRTVPVDGFNRAVWADAMRGQSPFGTRSPWGSNEQPMYTPQPAANLVSGIITSSGLRADSASISPWDIARTAASVAVSSGIGGVAGALAGASVGKTLGALAGLKPQHQQTLQQAGLWSGVLSTVPGALGLGS